MKAAAGLFARTLMVSAVLLCFGSALPAAQTGSFFEGKTIAMIQSGTPEISAICASVQ